MAKSTRMQKVYAVRAYPKGQYADYEVRTPNTKRLREWAKENGLSIVKMIPVSAIPAQRIPAEKWETPEVLDVVPEAIKQLAKELLDAEPEEKDDEDEG